MIKWWFSAIVIIVVCGCGGSDFSFASNTAEFDAGGHDAIPAPEDGGAVPPATDADAAAPAAAGGRPGSGGASGGAGAVVAAGGKPSTGAGGRAAGGVGGALPAAGGRAAGGAPGAGGRPPEVDACAPTTHTNGVGQTWRDCVPLGTYDEAQAMKACQARTGDRGKCNLAPGCGTAAQVVQGMSDEYNLIWGFDGNTAGFVGVDGSCPNPSGEEWR